MPDRHRHTSQTVQYNKKISDATIWIDSNAVSLMNLEDEEVMRGDCEI